MTLSLRLVSGCLVVCLSLISSFAHNSSRAATFGWDGGSDPNDDSWGTSSNWAPNGTPDFDDVILLNSSSADGPQTIELDGDREIVRFDVNGINTAGGEYLFTSSDPNDAIKIFLAGGNAFWIRGSGGSLRFDTDILLENPDTTFRFNVATTNDTITVNGDIAPSATGGTTDLILTSINTTSAASIAINGIISDYKGADPNATTRLQLIAGLESASDENQGTIELAGLNNYTGPTVVNGATLVFNSIADWDPNGIASALGAPTNAADATIRMGATDTQDNFGMLRYTGSSHSSNRDFTLQGAGGVIQADSTATGGLTLSGGVTALTSSANSLELGGDSGSVNSIGGTISDGAAQIALSKTGTTTWVLSGSNTYSGGTTIEEGTLSVSADDNLGDPNGALTFTGGTLRVTGNTYSSTTRTINWQGGSLEVEDPNHSFAANIGPGGSDDLSKTGLGSLQLTGVNGISGTTKIEGGVLRIANGDSLTNSFDGIIGNIVGSNGTVVVEGTDGVGNRSTWTNSQILIVGRFGYGALDITAGGLVENTDGYIGRSPNSTGVVTVDGTDPNGNPSTWDNSGELNVGSSSGEGTLNLTGGGLAEMTTGYVGYAITGKGGASPKGLVTVAGADPNSGTRSTWHSSGDLFVGNSSLFSLGTYSINDGGMVLVDGELKIGSNGTVNLLGGTIDVVTLDLTDPGNTFNMTGGRLEVETVEGDLTIAVGTLAPGDSPELTTITGNYIQETGATLEIEIGSTEFGDFDRLEISGTATLGGTLKVVPVDLGGGVYQPQAGDSIGFLAAQLGAGDMFDAFDWPDLGPHLEWQINPGGITVFLEVRPTLPGDFDLDFDVDGDDFLLWQRNPNVGNLSAWQTNYGMVLPPPLTAAAKAVPEPSGLLLALAALCVASIKRRR